MPMESASDLELFWSHVDSSGGPSACWPWVDGKNENGYGRFRLHGGDFKAHRWILGYMRGAHLRWDDGLREQANHHCDNAACCNPDHLYVGTQKDNMGDALRRGRYVGNQFSVTKMECPQGHPYDTENTRVYKGARHCRTCNRERMRRQRKRALA